VILIKKEMSCHNMNTFIKMTSLIESTRNKRKKIYLSANASLISETLTVLVVRDASMSLPTLNVLLVTAPVVSIARIRLTT
jgi:hypothetical protein